MATPSTPNQDFPDLASAFDEESWEFLQDTYPVIATKLKLEVDKGGKPVDIRRFAFRYTGREEIARRCEQAAAYLKAERG